MKINNRLAAGEAEALVMAKLDRLSRSLVDVAGIIAWLSASTWH